MLRSMICVVTATIATVAAQAPPESQGTPAAKAAYDAGMAAVRAGDRAKAAPLFRKAIDEDPRFVQAHDEFINATLQAAFAYDPEKHAGNPEARDRAEHDLKQQYEGWAA